MERHHPHGRTVTTLEADVLCEIWLFQPISFEDLIKKIFRNLLVIRDKHAWTICVTFIQNEAI